MKKEEYGLYHTHTEIFEFLSHTCAYMFTWEIADMGPGISALDRPEAFYRLYEEVKGTVASITDSAAARAIYGSYGALQLVMKLRELYWRKYYKGVVAHGKVTFVKFKSDLTEAEERFLEENINALRSHVLSMGNDRY